MMDTLGDFLRARRELIRPEDVGMVAGARRRVPGLRREEVALLAGISAEYYLRLEQGRDLHPSDQILTALASALQLDDDAVAYLHRLAHPAPRPARRRRSAPAPSLQPLVDSWPATPAYVQDAAGRVTAANRPAVALCPFFAVGQTPLRSVFLEPEMRRFYVNWADTTAKAVSGLRATLALGGDAEPGLLELIGELTVASDRFRTLWARRDVRGRTTGLTEIAHPLVGPLQLHYEKFQQPESRQLLVVYRPTPASTDRLQLLTTL
ncbi:helix-turn-helix transcriptional regulator [Catenuloplanes japonicus]|uniref:helix-turn-helix transcriptional regulator n=1 Tax=Catenuloplanes japonicus TaxID=33876 RepID=UPI000690C4AC|nr:helix-turn-helix transcriptional regulator [Catenuloplanes japonicus]